MLKLSLIEFFLRGLPEEFLLIFAVHAFSKTAINIKRYVITSVFFVTVVYLIRLLPIQYGVHTILGLIASILLIVNINKIDIIKAIQASIMAIILEFICETMNIFIIVNIFKVDIDNILKQPLLKVLYGIPSLLIFAGIVFVYYYSLSRRKKLREVSYGEISK